MVTSLKRQAREKAKKDEKPAKQAAVRSRTVGNGGAAPEGSQAGNGGGAGDEEGAEGDEEDNGDVSEDGPARNAKNSRINK